MSIRGSIGQYRAGAGGSVSKPKTMQEAFLESILAAPDDDGPRLIYADWLEETGIDPERAEFIRLQIFCANNPDPHGFREPVRHGGAIGPKEVPNSGCKWCDNGIRAYTLFNKNYHRWTRDSVSGITLGKIGLTNDHSVRGMLFSVAINGPSVRGMLAGYPMVFPDEGTIGAVYRKGFLEQIHCEDRFWVTFAKAFTGKTPVRRVVFIGSLSNDLVRRNEERQLSRLEGNYTQWIPVGSSINYAYIFFRLLKMEYPGIDFGPMPPRGDEDD